MSIVGDRLKRWCNSLLLIGGVDIITLVCGNEKDVPAERRLAMYVRDIMTTNVVTIPSSTSIADAKRIM